MNAQQQMVEYAKSRMNEMGQSKLTPEQWCGKMIQEGIVISRDGDIVSANARREGKTIIITETTKTETLAGWEKSTVEVMRINL